MSSELIAFWYLFSPLFRFWAVRYIKLAISSAFERSLLYRIVSYRIVLVVPWFRRGRRAECRRRLARIRWSQPLELKLCRDPRSVRRDCRRSTENFEARPAFQTRDHRPPTLWANSRRTTGQATERRPERPLSTHAAIHTVALSELAGQ